MAAALAFRTLFGLAPVLIVATIVVKAVKGSAALLASFRDLLVAVGLDKIQIVSLSESGTTAQTLAEWLEHLVGQLASTNLAAIGWVGFAVIIYAANSLLVTIEKSFNVIYRAPEGRPWTRRVPLYWFLLTISPAFLGLASYYNNQFDTWVASVDTWQWLLVAARTVWSFGFAWLFMFAVYKLIPNSTVSIRPAMTGALVAAALLEFGKHSLGAYLQGALFDQSIVRLPGISPAVHVLGLLDVAGGVVWLAGQRHAADAARADTRRDRSSTSAHGPGRSSFRTQRDGGCRRAFLGGAGGHRSTCGRGHGTAGTRGDDHYRAPRRRGVAASLAAAGGRF